MQTIQRKYLKYFNYSGENTGTFRAIIAYDTRITSKTLDILANDFCNHVKVNNPYVALEDIRKYVKRVLTDSPDTNATITIDNGFIKYKTDSSGGWYKDIKLYIQ